MPPTRPEYHYAFSLKRVHSILFNAGAHSITIQTQTFYKQTASRQQNDTADNNQFIIN
ncbi:hypothetical protein ETAE_2688 [Edwardsiella piscicida]|uniref:Uncharacterized protein n=1 Tax=Edwardsiella piscicida TaxID=1263550 RepID=A0AAU8P5I1_EDWPI|nr:hypothetical protein ETAE_2688 [Edwardsiella tarda EIB202]GBK55022.1 hypothetical protein JFPO13_contig000016-0038 [Edwardsiella piscicida]GBK57654.1 hypothetical protein JFPO14_contig00006-0038 [Edwardsiella piscicida]